MFNSKNTDKSIVKGSLEIYNLLKNICKSKQLISVSFESLPQHCLTSLLKVNYDTKVLIFDEPNPPLSSSLIASKNEAEFFLKLEHLPIKFKTSLIVNNNKKNAGNLYTPFPEEIYYPQNRDCHRFRTEYVDDINATIYLSSTKKLSCELVNISLNGLCLRFPYSFASKFQINQLINDVYIQLPNEKAFSVSAKVQNARIENNYANIALGLQVQQQKSSIEKKIQQFIFRTENF